MEGLRLVNHELAYEAPALDEPTTHGFVYLTAAINPGPDPRPVRGRLPPGLIPELRRLAAGLQARDDVVSATVFRARLFPPTHRIFAYLRPRWRRLRLPRFDVVVLVETTNVGLAGAVTTTSEFDDVLTALTNRSRDVQTLIARNAKRLGHVDHTRDGVFVFNHFVADDPDVFLSLFDHMAAWFELNVGVDNTLLLVPDAGEEVDYVGINHARLNMPLPVFLLRQFARQGFWTYVVENQNRNRVGALPVLYRLA